MSEGQVDHDFEDLLGYLKRNRGFDFTGYKRSSLMRRVSQRLRMVGVAGFAQYRDYLEAHPEEFARLFNTVLINVTAFLRDREAWDYLSTAILPRILAAKGANEPVRVWSAGTASGEEAYTLAMLLAERLGREGFAARARIFATDVDGEALAHARHATYSQSAVEGVPPSLRARYFTRANTSFVFDPEVRRGVIFGRHDLVQDAPIAHLDLLVCRNTLMYFNIETQNHILSRFHFALNEGGYLFLGKAEMPLTRASLFTPVSVKERVFRRAPRAAPPAPPGP
ncbi:MAG: protein-glutamate O-methyltransferase CheR [Armatimonadetes bacterium]|jgi:two-component system CheB/CheR fusion protein|nr:protein-glutamate O-methyltransferase CheR [Armatimonadota bacterium]